MTAQPAHRILFTYLTISKPEEVQLINFCPHWHIEL